MRLYWQLTTVDQNAYVYKFYKSAKDKEQQPTWTSFSSQSAKRTNLLVSFTQ